MNVKTACLLSLVRNSSDRSFILHPKLQTQAPVTQPVQGENVAPVYLPDVSKKDGTQSRHIRR